MITIPGRAVPVVRTTQKAKFVSKSYARYRDYKEFTQTHLRNQFKRPPFKDYVCVYIDIYLNGKTSPMGRDGDIDNYCKSILDSANKILFLDDRQVVELHANKIKSKDERVEIKIYEVHLDDEENL